MSDIDQTIARLNRQLHATADEVTALRDVILELPPVDPEVVESILQAEYTAYLCMMSDHDCICVVLSFDDWLKVWVADV